MTSVLDVSVQTDDECAGCEGSRVIFPALLLTLDEYSS